MLKWPDVLHILLHSRPILGLRFSLADPARPVLCSFTPIIFILLASLRNVAAFIISWKVALAAAPGHCQFLRVVTVAIMVVHLFSAISFTTSPLLHFLQMLSKSVHISWHSHRLLTPSSDSSWMDSSSRRWAVSLCFSLRSVPFYPPKNSSALQALTWSGSSRRDILRYINPSLIASIFCSWSSGPTLLHALQLRCPTNW